MNIQASLVQKLIILCCVLAMVVFGVVMAWHSITGGQQRNQRQLCIGAAVSSGDNSACQDADR